MARPIRVVAAVIERQGRYLVCQRPIHKHHGGLWEFPGGKVESDESDAAALARELMEELGVQAVTTAFVMELAALGVASRPLTIAFWRAEISSDPINLEHQAMAWCSLAELQRKLLAPADAELVKVLGQRP